MARIYSELNQNNTSFVTQGVSGAFYWQTEWDNDTSKSYPTATNMTSGTQDTIRNVPFDASRSNSIYGNSTHVTPETVAVLFGVYAIGTVVSIGEATEEGILAELGNINNTIATLDTDYMTVNSDQTVTGQKYFMGALKAQRFTCDNQTNKNIDFISAHHTDKGFYLSGVDLDSASGWVKILTTLDGAHITATYSSGTSWYRKYSDGWIEQGGSFNPGSTGTLTFNTSFSSTNYTITLNDNESFRHLKITRYTTSSVNYTQINVSNGGTINDSERADWYACGY